MYIHQVPGRLRISHGTFRCDPVKAEALANRLRDLDGIRSVALNPKAGSITIHYDPKIQDGDGLLRMMSASGRVPAQAARPGLASQIGPLFGKALMGALAQRTAQTLVTAIL